MLRVGVLHFRLPGDCGVASASKPTFAVSDQYGLQDARQPCYVGFMPMPLCCYQSCNERGTTLLALAIPFEGYVALTPQTAGNERIAVVILAADNEGSSIWVREYAKAAGLKTPYHAFEDKPVHISGR